MAEKRPNKTLHKLNLMAGMLNCDGVSYTVRKSRGFYVLTYEFERVDDPRRPDQPVLGASRGLVDAWEAYQEGERIGANVAEAESALLMEIAEELRLLRGAA